MSKFWTVFLGLCIDPQGQPTVMASSNNYFRKYFYHSLKKPEDTSLMNTVLYVAFVFIFSASKTLSLHQTGAEK